MVVWLLVMLAAVAEAAVPDPPNPNPTSGHPSRLAPAAKCQDGVVAFSATQGSIDNDRVVFTETLVDKMMGYVGRTGTFVVQCPGLYQFSFAGYGSSELRLTLKRKPHYTDTWKPVVSVGPGGGANLVLLDLEVGDQVAVFVGPGKILDGATFSGYRIAEH